MTQEESTQPIAKAQFTPQTGPNAKTALVMQFNPVSLQLSISNTVENKKKNDDTKQYVTQTSAKLSMDLVFDSTGDGVDVRLTTAKVANFIRPDPDQNVLPVVLFEWGLFKFQGVVESYKETLDFFAASGVPLRAAISLTLASQEKVFENRRGNAGGAKAPQAVSLQPSGESVTDVANRAGDPGAARAIAAANNQESLRFVKGPLVVNTSVSLRSPAAFASAGAGMGLGISIGGSLNANLGLQAGISADIGLGAGSSASAGVSATAGAFAGLRQSTKTQPAVRLRPEQLLPPPAAALSTGGGASFGLGGQAQSQGSASLKTDVGASASLRSRLQFEE
ncbi:hypothetical protein ACQ4M4_21790 [Leptolyngbya sp. AN02str]|uniref:CIS tube protein n=1 Tax=Leptolyngbya sp. AN02str TaxID=3423363 RepID=UPI003D3108A0